MPDGCVNHYTIRSLCVHAIILLSALLCFSALLSVKNTNTLSQDRCRDTSIPWQLIDADTIHVLAVCRGCCLARGTLLQDRSHPQFAQQVAPRLDTDTCICIPYRHSLTNIYRVIVNLIVYTTTSVHIQKNTHIYVHTPDHSPKYFFTYAHMHSTINLPHADVNVRMYERIHAHAHAQVHIRAHTHILPNTHAHARIEHGVFFYCFSLTQ